MSVQETLIQMSSDAGAEPVQAVVIDATGSNIKRIIVEKFVKATPSTAVLIGAGIAATAAVGYGAYAFYKKRKASKSTKSDK